MPELMSVVTFILQAYTWRHARTEFDINIFLEMLKLNPTDLKK